MVIFVAFLIKFFGDIAGCDFIYLNFHIDSTIFGNTIMDKVEVNFLGNVVCAGANCFRWLEVELVCKGCPISQLLNICRTYFHTKELMIEHGYERDSDEQGEQGLAPEGV